jgi:hypothetical protein
MITVIALMLGIYRVIHKKYAILGQNKASMVIFLFSTAFKSKAE